MISELPISTLLQTDAVDGNEDAICLHIRRDEDVNSRDEAGRTPLLLAASRGHFEVCKLLLDAGADPCVIDNYGKNAIDFAVAGGRVDVIILMYMSRSRQTTDGVKRDVIAPKERGNLVVRERIVPESEFDISAWEEDETSPPPETHNEFLKIASVLQQNITAHIPFDTGADWCDVKIDLPVDRTGRTGKRAKRKRRHSALMALFLGGLQNGSVLASQIAEIARNKKGEISSSTQAHLMIVLEELGVDIEEGNHWGWQLPVEDECIDEDQIETAEEALLFFYDLEN